jgi:hypothetical protein
MRFLQTLALCCIFACGAMAQRGGGGHGGGGGGHMGGGGFGGGGHVGGGFSGGGFRGGGISGFRGGFGNGFRGYGYGYGYRGLYGGYYGWPYWGLGLGYWPYYDWGYDYYPYYNSYDYGYYPSYGGGYAGYGGYAYQTSPNVTVVYPQQSATAVYSQVPRPAIHEYDQYGQEVPQATSGGAAQNGSPLYLIALKNQDIQAAVAYWVNGSTLHYVTLEHAEKEVPLTSVNRELSMRLNSERHVPFQLPQ